MSIDAARINHAFQRTANLRPFRKFRIDEHRFEFFKFTTLNG